MVGVFVLIVDGQGSVGFLIDIISNIKLELIRSYFFWNVSRD